MPAGSSRTAVQRSSLREQIANAVREEMMAGRIPAGAHFTVKEIAELYGVSATPAREALVDLTAQGLLQIEHHRGFTVTELAWEDYLDIVEARVLLCNGVFRQLVRYLPAFSWDRLPTVRRRAEAATYAARAGQLDVLVGCDRRFWQEICGLVSNQRIGTYMDWLRVQSWMFAAPYLRRLPNLSQVIWDGYVEIVDQIERQEWAEAYRAHQDCNRGRVELLARLTGHQVDIPVRLPMLLDDPEIPVRQDPHGALGR